MSSIENLEASAFKYCTKIKSVELPNSLKTLGNDVFSGCTSLKTISLGSVEKIGDRSFYTRMSLKSIDLSHVVSIGAYAFRSCTDLETLDLSNVKNIGGSAFYGCSNLSSVTLGNLNGMPYEISGHDFKLKNNKIEINVGKEAFYGCAIPWKESFINNIGQFKDGTTFLFYKNVKEISERLDFFDAHKKHIYNQSTEFTYLFIGSLL